MQYIVMVLLAVGAVKTAAVPSWEQQLVETSERLPIEEELLQRVVERLETTSAKGLPVEEIRIFLDTLFQEGYAELEGTDAHCRFVCVTAQGVMEEVLGEMLSTGELDSVTAYFLTPLPTTPLRTAEVQELPTTVFEENARDYTVALRARTLRDLMHKGAKVVAAYSEERYNSYAQREENSAAVAVWNRERQCSRVVDQPLKGELPTDLVGALYVIQQKDGSTFYFPIQGVQVQDAKEGTLRWKNWWVREASTQGGPLLEIVTYLDSNNEKEVVL